MSVTPLFDEIQRNLPGSSDWQGSFYEQLTEHGLWSMGEFWKLHLCLVETAHSFRFKPVARNQALAVVTLQGKIMNLVAAHYDQNDAFFIRNLAPNELHAFVERFQHAVLSVFSGEVIPEASYDIVNPLIVHA